METFDQEQKLTKMKTKRHTEGTCQVPLNGVSSMTRFVRNALNALRFLIKLVYNKSPLTTPTNAAPCQKAR